MDGAGAAILGLPVQKPKQNMFAPNWTGPGLISLIWSVSKYLSSLSFSTTDLAIERISRRRFVEAADDLDRFEDFKPDRRDCVGLGLGFWGFRL